MHLTAPSHPAPNWSRSIGTGGRDPSERVVTIVGMRSSLWAHGDQPVMFAFQPDSSVVADVVPSPNCGQRLDGREPDMIVLHYTGMFDAEAALRRLCSPDSEVSAHYLVLEDGRVIQCVPESERAWHAGVSFWDGETDINSCSIGVEIANPGHDFGYPDFPPRQIAAVIALCRGIIARRGIRADRVLGHSDVAPARKLDPGEKFPWRLLSASGVGLWVKPAPIGQPGRTLTPGTSGDEVRYLQGALATFGYGIDPTGEYGTETQQVVTAFQRHFRPARIDGEADESTVRTLAALLEKRQPLLRGEAQSV
jgi:N-acetylmuramoyl-L-alanine amidase